MKQILLKSITSSLNRALVIEVARRALVRNAREVIIKNKGRMLELIIKGDFDNEQLKGINKYKMYFD